MLYIVTNMKNKSERLVGTPFIKIDDKKYNYKSSYLEKNIIGNHTISFGFNNLVDYTTSIDINNDTYYVYKVALLMGKPGKLIKITKNKYNFYKKVFSIYRSIIG